MLLLRGSKNAKCVIDPIFFLTFLLSLLFIFPPIKQFPTLETQTLKRKIWLRS